MHCINACQTASPLAQILLTSQLEHEHLHIHHSTFYFDHTAHLLTQSFTMAISQHDNIARVTKRTLAPKRLWSQAIKERIVQSAIYEKYAWAPFTNRPKSQYNAALQEALECTKCKHLELTPYMMKADIAMGLYITTQYPPYFANKSTPIEDICPLDTTSSQKEALTFWKDITFSQQQRYYEQVDAIIKRTEAESGYPATETTVLFAHYQMDSHIRQHYFAPKSMLSLCRNKMDVLDLRHWQWENAESEGNAFAEDPQFGVGWASDPTNSLDQQYEWWKMGEGQRERHLADMRTQWAEIQNERREQRMRSVTVCFKGEPVRVYRYEASAPPMSEEEIQELARRNAVKTTFNELLAQPL
jgi:hypothetical protein